MRCGITPFRNCFSDAVSIQSLAQIPITEGVSYGGSVALFTLRSSTSLIGGENAKQIDESDGSRRAVDVHGGFGGPCRVCHATGRNRGYPDRRAPSTGPLFYRYGGLGLPERNSDPLPRHYDSDRHLVDAMDVPRREGAVFHGDPGDRGRRAKHFLQCQRLQPGSVRAVGLGPRKRIWLQL